MIRFGGSSGAWRYRAGTPPERDAKNAAVETPAHVKAYVSYGDATFQAAKGEAIRRRCIDGQAEAATTAAYEA